MKPPRFGYIAPTTQAEALDAIREHGDSAKVLAGGQSLVPLLNFRLARPAVLVDLNGVAGLDAIGRDASTGEIVFGAMVRQSDAEDSPLVSQACPLVMEALKHVGHRTIRNRGTIGGSLAHADPAAELPLVLTLLDGRVRLASARQTRWLTAAEFFVSYLTTAMLPDEILVEVRYPGVPVGVGWGFEEFSRRAGDFALAAAAATLRTDEAGVIQSSAIAIAGGGPTPARAHEAERVLIGQRLKSDAVVAAAQEAAKACEPESDIHASGEYRKALIAVVVEGALRRARSSLGPH